MFSILTVLSTLITAIFNGRKYNMEYFLFSDMNIRTNKNK